MVKKMKLISLVLSSVAASSAMASGFQLLEQGTGLANAYAGSAAKAEDASTIFFNPAGMTQLKAHAFSVGGVAVKPTIKFQNQGSNVGTSPLASAGDGGDAGTWSFLPNAYLSMALTKDLYVGVGVGVPFGLKTEYDPRWVGAAQAVSFEIKTLNVNPSLAYRVNEKVSLGAGLNWQKFSTEYIRLAGTLPNYDLVKATLNLDDSAWGWNVGILLTPSPSTKWGLSYRSRVKFHPEGDVQISGDGSAAGGATAAAFVGAGLQGNIKTDLTVPDTFINSVSQKLSDKWEMLGDLSWTGWASIPKVDLMYSSGSLNGSLAQSLGTNFRNTWRVALGANYRWNDAWKLRFGVAYDQTPVRNAETRLVSLPDSDRIWFSVGSTWMPSKNSMLDLGLAYLYLRDAKIDNDQTAYGRGRVTGEYDNSAWLLGAHYSLSF